VGIVATIREALRIARTHKSLWLFGFFAAFGGNVGVNNGGGGQAGGPVGFDLPEPGVIAVLVVIVLAVIVGLIILRFLSLGALIEGVKRARANASMTVGEGFREGWAQWGVLFRIAILYFLANAASVALLVAPCVLLGRMLGRPPWLAIAVAVVIGVPWLVTLYILQAFTERIAVLENRHARDAIRRARLFLHGRLSLGLKLVVATVLGGLFVVAVAALVLVPVGLLLFAMAGLWGTLPSVAIGVLLGLPACFVFFAIMGTMTSGIWTIGYLTQVEQ
jgi:hypothetical protein